MEDIAMNWAHIHLILNHIPLIGIGFVILLFLVALFRRSNEMINVALIFVIIVALWAIPAYLTGEPAEEVVEHQPGISENLIHEHEEAAEIAFIFVEVVGGIALIALIARRYARKVGHLLTIITLLGLIVGGGLVAWVANLGGKINHPEIRSDTVSIGASSFRLDEEDGDD
jgi:Ca2+/Na+ antiporter